MQIGGREQQDLARTAIDGDADAARGRVLLLPGRDLRFELGLEGVRPNVWTRLFRRQRCRLVETGDQPGRLLQILACTAYQEAVLGSVGDDIGAAEHLSEMSGGVLSRCVPQAKLLKLAGGLLRNLGRHRDRLAQHGCQGNGPQQRRHRHAVAAHALEVDQHRDVSHGMEQPLPLTEYAVRPHNRNNRQTLPKPPIELRRSREIWGQGSGVGVAGLNSKIAFTARARRKHGIAIC